MTLAPPDADDVPAPPAMSTPSESGEDPNTDDRCETDPKISSSQRMWRRAAKVPWSLIVSIALFVTSAAVAAALYFGQCQDDQLSSAAIAKTVTSAAAEGTVAVLTYGPENLDRDLAAGKSHLTGEFLTYYTKFTDEIVAPAAKDKSVNTTAEVKRAVLKELHARSAKVLIFLDQTTTSKDNPDPVQAASSVMVTMAKVADKWLISAFDPL